MMTNGISEEIERVTGRPPLIIFEDLDKTDLADARDLFFEHATTLSSMGCRIIYTFPISLGYSNDFPNRARDYSWHFLLPNVGLYHQDGTSNALGRTTLTEVITKRVFPALFDGTALNDIIDLSGGLMRDLIRLVNGAVLIALTERAPAITSEMVRQSADDVGDDYRRVLLPEDYEALRAARNTKQIIPNEIVRNLLGNQSLLEYQNATAWCDVHPLVRPLLG